MVMLAVCDAIAGRAACGCGVTISRISPTGLQLNGFTTRRVLRLAAVGGAGHYQLHAAL